LPTRTLRACRTRGCFRGSPPRASSRIRKPRLHRRPTGEDVGRPAEDPLDLVVRLGHHLRVDPDAGHDEKHLFVLAARVVLAGRVVALHRVGGHGVRHHLHEPDVDPAVATGEDDGQSVRDPVDGEPEVAGEQVSGPAGQQAQRHVGADERRRHGAHRAVTAQRADDVDPRLHGLPGLADAGVCLGRLDPHRLGPAGIGAALGDAVTDGVEVVELRGIDDDGDPPERLVRCWVGAHSPTLCPRGAPAVTNRCSSGPQPRARGRGWRHPPGSRPGRSCTAGRRGSG